MGSWLRSRRFVVKGSNLANCIVKRHANSPKVAGQVLLMSWWIEAIHVGSNLLCERFDETVILLRKSHNLLKACASRLDKKKVVAIFK